MKKPVRSPVISVRVRAPLHERIVKAAKISGRTMSEEMAVLLERGLMLTNSRGDLNNSLVVPMKIGIAKLDLEPGDTLVCKSEHLLSKSQMDELGANLRYQLPEGVEDYGAQRLHLTQGNEEDALANHRAHIYKSLAILRLQPAQHRQRHSPVDPKARLVFIHFPVARRIGPDDGIRNIPVQGRVIWDARGFAPPPHAPTQRWQAPC